MPGNSPFRWVEEKIYVKVSLKKLKDILENRLSQL